MGKARFRKSRKAVRVTAQSVRCSAHRDTRRPPRNSQRRTGRVQMGEIAAPNGRRAGRDFIDISRPKRSPARKNLVIVRRNPQRVAQHTVVPHLLRVGSGRECQCGVRKCRRQLQP